MSSKKLTDRFEESSIVTSLLSRQDEVIAELDGLDGQILRVISEITADRDRSETSVDGEGVELFIAEPSTVADPSVIAGPSGTNNASAKAA